VDVLYSSSSTLAFLITSLALSSSDALELFDVFRMEAGKSLVIQHSVWLTKIVYAPA
jgi:hypothetical protein